MNELISLTYAFSSISEFLAMGKHGLYVWLSYGIFTICIAGLFLSAHIKSKQLKKSLEKLEDLTELEN